MGHVPVKSRNSDPILDLVARFCALIRQWRSQRVLLCDCFHSHVLGRCLQICFDSCPLESVYDLIVVRFQVSTLQEAEWIRFKTWVFGGDVTYFHFTATCHDQSLSVALKMELDASETESQQLAYSTQFFDFTPDAFIDSITGPSLDIINNHLDVS